MQKILFLLLVLGYFGSAAQNVNIDSVKKQLAKGIEDTNQVINYRILAGVTGNSDPAKAVEYAKNGVVLGKKIGFEKGVAGCYLNIAAAFGYAGNLDSALIYIDTAIVWAIKVGEPGRISLAYLNRGDYKSQLRNIKEALKDTDSSMVFAEKAGRDDLKARVYHATGNIYFIQDNWEQSLLYYDKGYQLYKKVGNKKMMGIIKNNLGNVYKHLKNYEESINSYEEAIELGTAINDLMSIPMYYSNMGDTYLKKRDFAKAEANALKAVASAKETGNDQNLAHAELVLSNAYLETGRYAAAIEAGQEAYRIFTTEALTEDREAAASSLGEAYHKLGQYEESYKFLTLSRNLSDSVAREKFDDEVASMQTSFKLSEKNKEIQILAKEKEIQNQKLQQQRLYIAGSILLALMVIAGTWLLINRNKLKQKMKELDLRNQIAADLHDEVGSSLSSINLLSQMAAQPGTDPIRKDDILLRMSSNARETMEKMSDLVWTIKPEEAEGSNLKQRMERFAYEICSTKNIDVTLALDKLDTKDLTMDQRKNMYLIFKEAINNAVKYSGTDKLYVSAANGNNVLTMIIKDEGKGFDKSTERTGNGLQNIQSRANLIGGKLEIDSSPGKGTQVKLVMPLTL